MQSLKLICVQEKEGSTVAKDILEVDVRQRKAISLSKAALLKKLKIDIDTSKLSLDESLVLHQVSFHRRSLVAHNKGDLLRDCFGAQN